MSPVLKLRNTRIIIFFIIALSLIFTVTNFVPLSVSYAAFLILLPSLLLFNKSWPPLLLSVGALIAYFIFLVLIYDPAALFSYEFYRRDGNVFIAFFPILLFGLMCFSMNIEKLLIVFTYTASVVIALVGMLSLLFGLWQDPSGTCYCYLFLTHNAAGGFIVMLTVLSIALWTRSKSISSLCLMLLNLVALYKTDSRGSVLALFGAIFMHVILKERHVKKIIGSTIVVSIILVTVTYPIWEASGKDLSWSAEEADALQLVQLNFERNYTFLDRAVFLWPRATYLWLKSPLIGTGFGSYNDVPYNLEGFENFVMLNFPDEYIYTDAHAHHTFFNIIAETGLVGLVLTIVVLVVMRRFILNLESPLVRNGLILMFWVAVWASMTEHRLFTPSQMLPFTILLGLTLGNERAKSGIFQKPKIPKPILQWSISTRKTFNFIMRKG